LPSDESLVEGNCFIVPMNHYSSSITCDEDVHAEIEAFKSALVKMFNTRSRDCVFIEQFNASKKYAHLVIECLPLDRHVSDQAPIYFKKAIMESESEWAQNKSVINLRDKSLRKTIPDHMPFFCVTFGLDEGYAHLIEENEAFPDHFGRVIFNFANFLCGFSVGQYLKSLS
jgi:hypothetical protein